MLQAVLKALREREAQLLTVQAIEADISKRQKALALLEEQVCPSACSFPIEKLLGQMKGLLLPSGLRICVTKPRGEIVS